MGNPLEAFCRNFKSANHVHLFQDIRRSARKSQKKFMPKGKLADGGEILRLERHQQMLSYLPGHGTFPDYEKGQVVKASDGQHVITSVGKPFVTTHEDAGVTGRFQYVMTRPATSKEIERDDAKQEIHRLTLTLKADYDALIPDEKRSEMHADIERLTKIAGKS